MNRRGFLGTVAAVVVAPYALLRGQSAATGKPLMLNLPMIHFKAGDRIILGQSYPTMPVIGDTICVRMPQRFTVKANTDHAEIP